MPDISKIQLDSAVYNIKDETARNNLQTFETNTNQEIANLKKPKNYFTNKKFLLIGDSYAEGYTPDGNVTSWQQHFINLTGLSNTIRKYQGGAGFVNISNNKTFQTLLEEVTDDNNITDIVVLGGYNDTSYNNQQIYNAIKAFQLKANEKFPNANIYIGAVGWSKDGSKIYTLNNLILRYKTNAPLCNCGYLKNIEYSLHEYFASFSSDGIHPNGHGQYWIATNLIQALLTGSADVQFGYTNINITPNTGVKIENLVSFGCTFSNNIVEVANQGENPTFRFTTPITASGRITTIEIGTLTSGYIIGSEFPICRIPVRIIIGCQEGFKNAMGILTIKNGKIYLGFGQANDAGDNYQTYTNISQIQIGGFHGIFNSAFC